MFFHIIGQLFNEKIVFWTLFFERKKAVSNNIETAKGI
jgi:hypothetical protein